MRCLPRIPPFPSLVAVLAAAVSAAQESVLSHHTLATDLVPGDARFDLLLPPFYDSERREPYPLLLWLHGGGIGEGQLEARLRAPLERAWNEGTIEAIVVVAPITGSSYYIDWKGGGRSWETFLLDELLAHVRASYRVAQGRAGTLIGGGSAGGQGTLADRAAEPRDLRRRRGPRAGISARRLLRGFGPDALRPTRPAILGAALRRPGRYRLLAGAPSADDRHRQCGAAA